jgi:hypothetical protein
VGAVSNGRVFGVEHIPSAKGVTLLFLSRVFGGELISDLLLCTSVFLSRVFGGELGLEPLNKVQIIPKSQFSSGYIK